MWNIRTNKFWCLQVRFELKNLLLCCVEKVLYMFCVCVCLLCYLERFVEEGLYSLRQTSNQSKRVSQDVQTQNQNIHLLQELQPETTWWSYIRDALGLSQVD